MIQGYSEITKNKERDLRGLVSMRLIHLQKWVLPDGRIGIRDAFCGGGENTIEGITIDGSPLSIMKGIENACWKAKEGWALSQCIKARVSDIRKAIIQPLNELIEQQCSFKPDLYAHNHYSSLMEAEMMAAAVAIVRDRGWLENNLKNRYMLFLDPNGPKDLPYSEVAALLNSKAGRERADVILNISATAIKRILGFEAAQKNIADWIGSFDDIFVKALGAKNDAWIRRPIEGDQWQWTMLVFWSNPVPVWDWRKRGYVKLDSAEGRDAIDVYTSVRKKTATRRLRIIEGGKD